MKDSHIQWTDHTFNPWIGCTKVSPGCENCYAEARDLRFAGGKHWGKGAPRQRTTAENWKGPIRWNLASAARAALGQPRMRVFCASLADWLDDEVCCLWFVDLLRLIHSTPSLDWQLLTKRPENWLKRMIPALNIAWGIPNVETPFAVWVEKWLTGEEPPANVWIGATVEDQVRANQRIPALCDIPAKVRFLSCEPLIGKVDFLESYFRKGIHRVGPPQIQWVIVGAESGPGRRPMKIEWAREILSQCRGINIAPFMKQMEMDGEITGDFDKFPGSVQAREFPIPGVHI